MPHDEQSLRARNREAARNRRSNAESSRAYRDREAREREEGLALVRRVRPKRVEMDAKALEAIRLYRAEKAKRIEAGMNLNGSSGRHPRINDSANSSRGLMRVAI